MRNELRVLYLVFQNMFAYNLMVFVAFNTCNTYMLSNRGGCGLVSGNKCFLFRTYSPRVFWGHQMDRRSHQGWANGKCGGTFTDFLWVCILSQNETNISNIYSDRMPHDTLIFSEVYENILSIQMKRSIYSGWLLLKHMQTCTFAAICTIRISSNGLSFSPFQNSRLHCRVDLPGLVTEFSL